MLKVVYTDPPEPQQAYLDKQQDLIDELGDFAAQVDEAGKLWAGKSRSHFRMIRQELEKLCFGARRCHYCEDSAADEVEHIWPKRFYPERTFCWANYLFSCGPCNGSYKRDQFPLQLYGGEIYEQPTRRDGSVTPPPGGRALFIDPRIDDPMEFFELDLETGVFLPCHEEGTVEYLRAKWTEKVLRLNRDFLAEARQNVYRSYRDSLAQYVHEKQSGVEQSELDRRRNDLYSSHHPTVWREMIRSRAEYPAINAWFEAAPELLMPTT
jgi:uncharacterized protein (TIGR02646 family)